MSWRPVTVPGRPPKECACCAALPAGERPKTWRPTDHAPRTPRCATHQRSRRNTVSKRASERRQETTYGLDAERHTELLSYQGGVCWICRYANGATKALATDHDHATGLVRGKLCGPDNQDVIGRIEMIAGRNGETVFAVIDRIRDYFADPPMARLTREKVTVS